MSVFKSVLGVALVVFCCAATGAQDGCSYQETSDQRQSDAQETLAQQATSQTGMPDVHNFAERKLLKEIYELRDKMQPTHTYIADMNGHLHKLCDSFGYAIPYSTEYTNPQQITTQTNVSGFYVLPQADPNTLFSPSDAEGTWIVCLNPNNPNEQGVVYSEPSLITSPFPLNIQ